MTSAAFRSWEQRRQRPDDRKRSGDINRERKQIDALPSAQGSASVLLELPRRGARQIVPPIVSPFG